MYRILITVREDELTPIVTAILNTFGGPIEIDGVAGFGDIDGPRRVPAGAAPSPTTTNDLVEALHAGINAAAGHTDGMPTPTEWIREEVAIVAAGETGIPTADDDQDRYFDYVDQEKAKAGQYTRYQQVHYMRALQHRCTTCNAKPNQPCVRANGAVAGKPHNGRLRAGKYIG